MQKKKINKCINRIISEISKKKQSAKAKIIIKAFQILLF